MRVLVGPAVEQDLRRTIGHQIAVAIGDEHQVRRGTDPHATEADLEPADQVELAREHRARLERAIVIAILEDHDVVGALVAGSAHWIGERFGHPQSATIVDRQRDRLVHVGLGGDHVDLEARRYAHRARRVGRGEPGVLDFVVGRRLRDASGQFEARALGVEAEVVEVEMPPTARLLVDQVDADLLADVRSQVDDDSLQKPRNRPRPS